MGCSQPPTPADTKQIFSDQQRSTVQPSQYPYIFKLETGCTGFIIDNSSHIGMSAEHCNISVGLGICFGSTSQADCFNRGAITEILEDRSSAQRAHIDYLDYVIFRFSPPPSNPWAMAAVKVSGTRTDVSQLLQNRDAIAMVGYPSDRYQNGAMTRSDCFVRSPINRYAFANSRDVEFHTDCSVYGGNSGGPVFHARSQLVLGMPGTYFPEGMTPTWNQLQRTTIDRQTMERDFPRTRPLAAIVESSPFFRQTPQYVGGLDQGNVTTGESKVGNEVLPPNANSQLSNGCRCVNDVETGQVCGVARGNAFLQFTSLGAGISCDESFASCSLPRLLRHNVGDRLPSNHSC